MMPIPGKTLTLNSAAATAGKRFAGWPQQVLTILPLTLFFPVGVMYAGLLAFYVALLLAGGWKERGQRLRHHPMLLPVLGLSVVSMMIGLTQDRPDAVRAEFWPAFGHYQTYLFLLPFLLVPAGEWQQKAMRRFQYGAIAASTIFVLNALHWLPEMAFFHSYQHYIGNKSILLGILLAIAAGWMLNDWCRLRDRHWQRALCLLYVVAVLVLLSKTRTASLLLLLMAAMTGISSVRWSWRRIWIPALLLALAWGAWQAAFQLGRPANCVINDVQAQPWDVLQIRTRCTLYQVHDMVSGNKARDEDGMRTEIYRITAGIIAEKPWTGHGIASWMPLYRERAAGLSSASMTTPHNDYLLYATELGLVGLAALLLIWFRQWGLVWQMSRSQLPEIRRYAMPLAMLTVSMMVGGLVNAILRDAVFGLAFMILLAIPLAGLQSGRPETPA